MFPNSVSSLPCGMAESFQATCLFQDFLFFKMATGSYYLGLGYGSVRKASMSGHQSSKIIKSFTTQIVSLYSVIELVVVLMTAQGDLAISRAAQEDLSRLILD